LKKLSKNLLLLLLVGIVALAVGCSAETEQPNVDSGSSQENTSPATPVSLNLATLTEGGAWYIYGATMAEILQSEVEEIQRVDVLPYAGGLGNVEILAKGEAELALTFSLNNRWAAEGAVAYDKKHENLRALVGGLDQYYIGILMTDRFIDKYDIQSIADIKDKEIPVRLLTLNNGSQGEFGARQVLDAHGLDYDTLKSYGGSVSHTSFDVVQSSIQDNKADMFIQVMTKGHPAFTEIAIQTPVTFMSVEDDNLSKLTDSGYVKAVLPANVFEGQDQEVQTIGLTTTLATTTELSEELAYNITKALLDNSDKLKAGHNALKDFNPEKGAEAGSIGGIPLHPGAEKYYKEKGWID
jgi:TRAP transporter TAXI family solute receptor